MADENLDPDLLLWDMRRNLRGGRVEADPRFVVRIEFAAMPSSRRRYWLIFERGEADVCIRDPGFEVDLFVSARVRALTEVWLGHVSFGEALRGDGLRIEGSKQDITRFRDCLGLGVFAPAGREPPGQAAE